MDNERGAREGGGGDIGGELKGGRVRVTTLGSALVDCRSVVTACSYREPHESYYNKPYGCKYFVHASPLVS